MISISLSFIVVLILEYMYFKSLSVHLNIYPIINVYLRVICMDKKPTYEELEKRIKELERTVAELKGDNKEISKSESRLKEAEQIAQVGHWELDLVTNTLCWSDEIYRVFDLNPKDFGATYEAFLDAVHPDDRKFVNDSYTRSLKERSGYDIVHRLLLKDGTIKYVHEICRTTYNKDGKPLRSIGTVQDITRHKKHENGFAGIIGRNAAMRKLFKTIQEISKFNLPTLVQGDSGTGKELVALAIHNEGPRVNKSFVPVNCGALPEGLLESELFGHVKGAFTGAMRDRKGRFELARGGTLFLDEIGEMPKSVQVKLLRVLQDGKFERVGDEKTITADVQIISASNRDLKAEVKKGNFREDLYYRINVIPIHIPPLKKRKDDIPLLVNHFLEKAAREGRKTKGVSEDALAVMINYPWPGNIRELQSALQYAILMSKGKVIQPDHLPLEFREYQKPAKTVKTTSGRPPKLDVENVKEVMTRTGGNKAKAARLLGVGRATLYNFLENNPDLVKEMCLVE
jgi:PAS domain S-box-containing protein